MLVEDCRAGGGRGEELADGAEGVAGAALGAGDAVAPGEAGEGGHTADRLARRCERVGKRERGRSCLLSGEASEERVPREDARRGGRRAATLPLIEWARSSLFAHLS